MVNGDAGSGVLIHVAREVDLSLFGAKGAVWEGAVVELRLVVVDISHPDGDPYACLSLVPVDAKIPLSGLRAERRGAQGEPELRSRVTGGRWHVARELTVTSICTSSASLGSSSLSREALTKMTPSFSMSNHVGLVESDREVLHML